MNQKPKREKNMRFILKIISASILLVMLTTLIAPASYLAWRAGQPMELPQFNGLTYYQYLDWRKTTLHQMAVDYQTAHPNEEMGGGLDMCYKSDAAFFLAGVPMVGFYTLAGMYPTLEKYVNPRDRKYIPEDVTPGTFLPNWWKTFESYVWFMASGKVYSAVAYCRLGGTPPVSYTASQ